MSQAKAPWLIPLLAGALFLTVLVWGFLKPGPPSLRVGDRAPDFSLSLLDGDQISLKELRGQVVVLNFWASWCGPCRLEAPVLEQVWQDYAGGAVVFVGIAHNDVPQRAQDFVEGYGMTFPNGLDITGQVARTYGLTGVPETIVIDGEGVVQAYHRGAIVGAGDLESMIEEALNASP
jgi:cytochrome c biogenesis protein CcmG/thiol:disulfide interchange protein DsbE